MDHRIWYAISSPSGLWVLDSNNAPLLFLSEKVALGHLTHAVPAFKASTHNDAWRILPVQVLIARTHPTAPTGLR